MQCLQCSIPLLAPEPSAEVMVGAFVMADVQAELQMVVIPAQAGIHLSGRETVRAKKVKSYERTQHVIENKG